MILFYRISPCLPGGNGRVIHLCSCSHSWCNRKGIKTFVFPIINLASQFYAYEISYTIIFVKQLKPTHAVQAARKHFQKAAKKHMKSQQRQPSLDFSVLSSEDGRGHFFRRDVDTISEDSKNEEMSPMARGPAAKAAIHKGAMSEPVRRAYRVKIHEPPETRRGFFSRMSSTDSNQAGAAPYVREESFDLDTSSQLSYPNSPPANSQNQTDKRDWHKESTQSNCGEQQSGKTFEPELFKLSEASATEEDVAAEPEQPPEVQSQTDSVSQPQPVPQPGVRFFPLIPPSSPARVRRTLEAPTPVRPSTPIRTKTRSRSCPRKQTTSPLTPAVNHRQVFRWQTENQGSDGKHVKRIPNGLCLSDGTSSSSDGSTDSLELVASCVPAGDETREGTLQREMKALFDQKMREIRCKSPLFLDGESNWERKKKFWKWKMEINQQKELQTQMLKGDRGKFLTFTVFFCLD